MRLSLATVKENFDTEGAGTVKAELAGTKESIDIFLSSYYNTRGKGTIKAPVPITGSTIVVCKPTGAKSWIYLATCDDNVLVGDNPNPSIRKSSFSNNVDRTGAEKGGPGYDSDLVIQNDLGCGIELCQTIGKVGNTIHTKLFTPAGKYISLTDSAPREGIILNTGKGSLFVLTAHPSTIGAPRQGSILDTVGSQIFTNRNGATVMKVLDGADLTLRNKSTGYNQLPANRFKSGHINIQSDTNGINLITKSGKSKIFLECLADTSPIPNPPDNQIVIRSGPSTPGGTSKVILEASEVQINAGKISFLSNGSVDVRSVGTMNLTGDTSINLRSNGNINIDGAAINLNSNLATTANVEGNTPGLPLNPYGPAGLI